MRHFSRRLRPDEGALYERGSGRRRSIIVSSFSARSLHARPPVVDGGSIQVASLSFSLEGNEITRFF